MKHTITYTLPGDIKHAEKILEAGNQNFGCPQVERIIDVAGARSNGVNAVLCFKRERSLEQGYKGFSHYDRVKISCKETAGQLVEAFKAAELSEPVVTIPLDVQIRRNIGAAFGHSLK